MSRTLWLVVVCAVQCWGMSPEEVEDFSNFLLQTSSLDIHVKKGADPDGLYDDDDIVSEHAWEESGKFEGDLILNDRQRKTIVDTVEGLARNGLTDSTKRWPNNEVIYFIQREHFNGGQVQAIQDGIEELAQASCVKFRPYRKGDRDAVVIQGSRRGCFSQVGYQGGYQVLNLSGRHPVGRGCFRHGTVVHEMLHTLGFYHMQSSPDRDDYIDVVWANIVQPARHNFRKYNSFSVSDFGVGYDYDSVLHYSRKAFSSNGQDTLVPKMSGAEIGQRVGLSDKDTQKLNKMYCDADNDAVLADENSPGTPKNKKKKPKNQPFQGHGIGYHQGKTVVIKLPAAETYKLRNVPSTDVFDFSKTPQVVSTSEAEGHRFGKEITTYPYTPFTSLNRETVTKLQKNYGINPTLNIKIDKQQPNDDTVETPIGSKDGYSLFQYPGEVKPRYGPIDNTDTDLHNSYLKIDEEVKQRIYPKDQGYSYKINKDYSTFYTPVSSDETGSYQDSPHGRFESSISYNPIAMLHTDKKETKLGLIKKSDDVLKNSQLDHRMDHSYRTSLPTKRPYSSYEQTETPPYATLEYLKNRHDFSNFYSLKTPEGNEDWIDGPTNIEENHKKDHIKIDPYVQQSFYTSNIKDDNTKKGEKYILKEEFGKDIKPSRYVLPEKPNITDSGTQLRVPMDGYYSAILLPTKKPYSAYEQTDTPKYATLEYLKNRHDISGVYMSNENDKSTRKVYENERTNDSPPTKNEWPEQSPPRDRAAHNRDSNSYYAQNKENDAKDRLASLVFDEDFDKDEQSIQSPKKYQPNQTERYHENFYSDYVKPKFENSDISGESPQSNSDYDRYFKIYENEDSDPRHTSSEEHISERVTKNNNSKQSPLRYDDGQFAEYEGSDRKIPAYYYENSDENKRGSKSQDYTLYSAPVSITKDYKRRR